MPYTIIAIIAFLVLVFIVVFLMLFRRKYSAKSENTFSSTDTFRTSKDINDTLSEQAFSAKLANQQPFVDRANAGGLIDNKAIRTPESARMAGPTPATTSRNYGQNYPDLAASRSSQQESRSLLSSSSLTPLSPVRAQTRYELEQKYEQGMRTIYDEEIGAVNFIGIDVVMNTPAEVELAFYVCKRQIRHVLQSRGLERAPTLTDIAGLVVVGREATAAWGQALKQYLEEMCIKIGKDTYLVAHYNSKADRPGQNQLQEKIIRIQLMTAAAINNFQSNIFDTREEAAAFLQRMREVYRV
jgi:hypothetical protein